MTYTDSSQDTISAFYAALASTYDLEFLVRHRRMYDRMAWETVTNLFAESTGPLHIVDIGCGTGRWARLLVDAGHEVIGIEPCDAMAAMTETLPPHLFTLQSCGVDDAEIDDGWADLVIAMGSVQYAPQPHAAISRSARWLAPGGYMAVLVDSLGGLVLELLARGDREQAIERATTRRARWRRNNLDVEYHLFDAEDLARAMEDAGLDVVGLYGLLVSSAVSGHDHLASADGRDLDIERELACVRPMANSAKQLLAIGRKSLGW